MTRGELYWVEFPPSDGHEQAGRRPAVVVQDAASGAGLSTVFVVPATGQPANLRFPGAVAVPPSAANGLLKPSVVLVGQLRALDRKRFRARIGAVDPADLAAIFAALDRLTGRPASPPPPAPAPAAPPAVPA